MLPSTLANAIMDVSVGALSNGTINFISYPLVDRAIAALRFFA